MAGLSVLVALWWAFRPEKLWINQTVNEPAPFDTSAGPQPILTGRFEGKERQASGRATIYKKPDGEEYLRLKDLVIPDAPDVHVVLAPSAQTNLAQPGIDFGPLKSDPGDQTYTLPAATDLNQDRTVAIYSERLHEVIAWAKLESF